MRRSILFTLLILSGTAPLAAEGPVIGSNDLVIGTTELPRNFNPYYEYNQIEHVINGLVFDGLMQQVKVHRDPREAYLENTNLLATDLVKGPDKSGKFSGIFFMALREGIASHGSGALTREDLRKTVEGIHQVPQNLYHLRDLKYLEPDGGAEANEFGIQVSHPLVDGAKFANLYMHLTFPVVREPRDAKAQIDSPGQLDAIDGSGPYDLVEYDLTANKIVLERFMGHSLASPPTSEERRVDRVVIEFVDRLTDLERRFQNGEFQVLLNHVGTMSQPPGRDYRLDPSPWLNSFTYLGFNRNREYRGPGHDLFRDRTFRKLVWQSLDSSVYRFIANHGGARLLSLQKLTNPDNRSYLVRYGDGVKDDEIKAAIARYFRSNPALRGKKIGLKYKGFVPHHADLARLILSRLRAVFEGHVEFDVNPKTVGQEIDWNRVVIGERDFDLVLDTFYYGINDKTMNRLFLKPVDDSNPAVRMINLTGAEIDDKSYEYSYDRYLIDVNNGAEVVVLGAFKRFNILDKTSFAVRQGPSAPLFQNLQNWGVR